MNIDAIIKNCKSLETLLERNYKASGKGLHEKISSVESKLPANLVSMLRFVATIRNKAVHEDGFTLSDAEMEIFLTKAQACELLLANIDNQTSNHKPYSENIKQNIVKPKCQIVQGGKLIKLQPFACACGSSISMDYFNCSCGNNFFDINSYSYSVQQGLLFNSKKFYCNFNVEISLSGAKQSELIQYCNQLNRSGISGICCTRCGSIYFVVNCSVCNRACFADSFVDRRSPGLCFISTAVFKAKGLPDDCEELTLLRNFRDTTLLTTEHGRLLVEEYYRIAPGICGEIDGKLDSSLLYRNIYDLFLRKIIENIRSGVDVSLVVRDYVAMVNFSKQLAAYDGRDAKM